MKGLKGFSVFSALIGTLIFIIAVLLITLLIRTDMILKTDALYTQENTKLEGTAAITNVVFQATTVLETKNESDKFFNIFNLTGPKTINIGTVSPSPSKTEISNRIYNILKEEFSSGMTISRIKANISTQVLKTVLGQANLGGEATKAFEDSFDLELDPKKNRVNLIIKKPVILKIDQGGVYKEYEFSLVSSEVPLSWNISGSVNNFSERLRTLINNLSKINGKILASMACKCILHKTSCCLKHCSKGGCCHHSVRCSTCTYSDSGYIYNNIINMEHKSNKDSCPSIEYYYNDEKFKKDLKEYIKKLDKNLKILNGEIKFDKVINESTKTNYICNCGGGCGNPMCIGSGDKIRYYKIKGFEIEVPLKMKLCKIKNHKKCIFLKVFAKIKI